MACGRHLARCNVFRCHKPHAATFLSQPLLQGSRAGRAHARDGRPVLHRCVWVGRVVGEDGHCTRDAAWGILTVAVDAGVGNAAAHTTSHRSEHVCMAAMGPAESSRALWTSWRLHQRLAGDGAFEGRFHARFETAHRLTSVGLAAHTPPFGGAGGGGLGRSIDRSPGQVASWSSQRDLGRNRKGRRRPMRIPQH